MLFCLYRNDRKVSTESIFGIFFLQILYVLLVGKELIAEEGIVHLRDVHGWW